MASQIQNLLERTLGDGARSTNFEVEFHIGDDSVNKKLNESGILVKSTSLPTRTHQIIDFKYRGKSIPLRGQTKYSQTWECTFYVTEQHNIRDAIERIMDSLDNINDYKINERAYATSYNNKINIYQKDHSDEMTAWYTLYNVFPIEVGAISYDSSQVGVIAEMSVTFAYSYYDFTGWEPDKSENAIDSFVNKYTKKLNDFKPADLYGQKGLIAAAGTSITETVEGIKDKWDDLLDDKELKIGDDSKAPGSKSYSTDDPYTNYDKNKLFQGSLA